jgi:hypothetical protein
VGGVEEEARERVGGARVEEDEGNLHALLERAAKLMVKADYSAEDQGGGEKRRVTASWSPAAR